MIRKKRTKRDAADTPAWNQSQTPNTVLPAHTTERGYDNLKRCQFPLSQETGNKSKGTLCPLSGIVICTNPQIQIYRPITKDTHGLMIKMIKETEYSYSIHHMTIYKFHQNSTKCSHINPSTKWPEIYATSNGVQFGATSNCIIPQSACTHIVIT